MVPGLINQQIRRSNRNTVLTCVVILALVAAMTYPLRHYLYNFWMGPLDINAADIPKLGDPDKLDRYWFRVKLDPQALEPDALTREWQRDGNTVSTSYYRILDLPQGALVVQFPEEKPTESVEGTLEVPTDKKLNNALMRLDRTGQPPLIPVIVSMSGIRLNGWVLTTFFGLVTLATLAALWSGIRGFINPLSDQACAVLRRFGDPKEIAVAVEAEVQAGAQKFGKVYLTQSWLIRAGTLTFELMFLGDVVWVYQKAVQRRSHGIPMGTTHSVRVYDKHGEELDLEMDPNQAAQLFAAIRQAVPWVFAGFSKEIESQWIADRQPLLKRSAELKELHTKEPSAAPAEATIEPLLEEVNDTSASPPPPPPISVPPIQTKTITIPPIVKRP